MAESDSPKTDEKAQKTETEVDLLAEKDKAIADLKAEKAELLTYKQKVEEYEGKLAEIRDYVRRMEREIELIRQRAERDADAHLDQKVSEVLSQFLGVMDNLDRSLATSTDKDASTAFFKGVEMIRKQFLDVLKQTGLERIKSTGEKFDPQYHEALTIQPVDTPEKDEMILEEVQAGYLYKDFVLRPAHVLVGRFDEADDE